MEHRLLPEPSREAGLARLERFVPSAGRDYAASRNFDFGPENRGNVSTLSPYIRHRLVLETEVLRTVLDLHAPSRAAKFVEEVFWRAYFKGWLEHRPSVWSDYRDATRRLVRTCETDADLSARYESAVAGNTGIDCFDAWAKELVQTGYLHNHARMWFASIWVFTLGLPWQLGADFFYRHLLDGDPASNTLGWRWVSGLHTPGKHYLARAENIAKYTEGRFNPLHLLVEDAQPLTEEERPALNPWRPPDCSPRKPFGLLITEEDCCPENLFTDQRPLAALGLTASENNTSLPVSRVVREFSLGAVECALRRANETYDIPAEHQKIPDWSAQIRDWCTRHQINTVVTAYPPIGAVADDRLGVAAGELQEQGIKLCYVARRLDRITWPHATSGYFKLKKRIPQFLKQLGLT